MPTTEENVELIETIKNPEKHYRIVLTGYGSETTFTEVSKEVHDYWEEKDNDDLVEYCVSPDGQDVDTVGDFLYDSTRDMWQMWYDNDKIVQNFWGMSSDASAYITVEQLVNNDHGADIIRVLHDQDDLDTDEFDVEWSQIENKVPPYVMEFNSVEKGTFFDITVTLTETFDIKKLQFVMDESLSGENFIVGVKYNEEELENWGGDTVGKGYFAQIFETQEITMSRLFDTVYWILWLTIATGIVYYFEYVR